MRISSIFKCVYARNYYRSFILSKEIFGIKGSIGRDQRYRFYSTKSECLKISEEAPRQFSKKMKREAKAALLEYLHSTRGLQYSDADHISGNSPVFLNNLMNKVNSEIRSAGSVSRYLRYHPINEFEPFFESMGLHPSELSLFLPSKLIFLSDDQALIQNYRVFCSFGFARNKIGKIYKEAPEIFTYGQGVLESKLNEFSKIGFDQLSVVELVHNNPRLLEGNIDREFLRFLENLKSFGIEQDCIFQQFVKENSYEWNCLSQALLLFRKLGFSKEQLGKVISENPGLLFEGSGRNVVSIMGFLWKFGCDQNKIYMTFVHFPQVQTGMFLQNLRNCYHLFIQIDMPIHEIGNMFSSHTLLLGSCSLKKVSSLLNCLNTGKKKLRKMILEDPHVLKKWVLGKKVEPLPTTDELKKSIAMKNEFVLGLGFHENKSGIEKAIKAYRGKGLELQERFDCFVNAGLDPKDVFTIIKRHPNVLNQTKERIEAKIDFLVNTLGYPISSLISFPSYTAFNTQRVKLRILMYNWLKIQGGVDLNLSLQSIIACSEKYFASKYVNLHPEGHSVWEKLKNGFIPI
ncbi:hypothetical protein DM860_010514 [Cuscuta australis]|uniref:Uncharacterized protein n=1 Tax=Cuscuta australis TaxID=267555 RepID=A0A328E324_9ASTE|nr:hypothetical protein DM860_010514 [Cuscuta australis]